MGAVRTASIRVTRAMTAPPLLASGHRGVFVRIMPDRNGRPRGRHAIVLGCSCGFSATGPNPDDEIAEHMATHASLSKPPVPPLSPTKGLP